MIGRSMKAKKREMINTARHEISHAMIAREMGANVYHVCLRRDGSGYCDLDIPRAPIKNLRITVAGYVGERVLAGYKPSFKAMRKDIAQCDDVAEIMDRIANDSRVRMDVALPAAIKYVEQFVNEPANRARINKLAKKLLKTRVLYARDFR